MPVLSYTVRAAPADGVGATQTATGTSSPIAVTGLLNGKVTRGARPVSYAASLIIQHGSSLQAYAVTVTATSVIGESAPSAISEAVAPASVPDAPTAVVGIAGNQAVQVTFTPGSNQVRTRLRLLAVGVLS
jgi:hypothetical protein